MSHTEELIGAGVVILITLGLFCFGGLIALAHWTISQPTNPRDARGEVESDDLDGGCGLDEQGRYD